MSVNHNIVYGGCISSNRKVCNLCPAILALIGKELYQNNQLEQHYQRHFHCYNYHHRFIIAIIVDFWLDSLFCRFADLSLLTCKILATRKIKITFQKSWQQSWRQVRSKLLFNNTHNSSPRSWQHERSDQNFFSIILFTSIKNMMMTRLYE